MDSKTRWETENSAYCGKSEQELIAICDADGEAFGELVRRYRPMALRAAFCILRNALDAEDQVQSAFCKAFEHIRQFRQTAKFSTWLTRIVVNECLMQLRGQRRISIVSLEAAGHVPSYFALLADGNSPEKAAANLSLARLLEREVRRIPPLLRNAFVLCDIQQRPIAEVARRLGISVEAAKSRLSRAREELRGKLEPHLITRHRREVKAFRKTRKEVA